jgi:hypothetical protein
MPLTSFVDLMGDDRWTEPAIKARLHALIRSRFSEQAENEINRALQGHALGMHQLTLTEQAAVQAFGAWATEVTALGPVVRADAALLGGVLDFEQGLTTTPLQGAALALYEQRQAWRAAQTAQAGA